MGGAVADSICAYEWEGGRRGQANKNPTRSLWKQTSWEVGLGARGGWLSGFILGERWRCMVDANCYVTHRGGRGEGKGAENEFLRKEPNECMACPVSVSRGLTLLLSLQGLHQVVLESFLL